MKKRNKNLTITIRSTQDLFHAMPGLVTVKIILAVLISVFSVLNVQFLANIIEYAEVVIRDGTEEEIFLHNIALYSTCYIGMQICQVLLYYIENIWIVPKTEYFHHQLSIHLTEISLEATNQPRVQDMFWRAKDAVYQDRILNVFMSVFNVIPVSVELIGTMIVLGRYNIWLVLFAFISVVPSAAMICWVGKREYEFTIDQTKNNRFHDYLWNILTKKEGIRESRIYGFGPYLKKLFYEVHRENYVARRKLSIREDAGTTAANFCKQILYIVSIFFCVYLIAAGEIGIGAFSACIAVFSSMQGKAASFFSYFSEINSACKYAGDYYDFFDLQKENSGSAELLSPVVEMEMENVSYQYPNQKNPALNGVDLTVHKGELIVIVGENGSGKTTLSKVLMGLYKPTEGTLTVDGTPIGNVNLEIYYRKFSIAIQHFEKYAISLKDNVRISDMTSEDTKVARLFEENDLLDVKERLGGYDAMLGIQFGDAELSGGEWQRIALARSANKESEIVVFDEPTSAIDPLKEYDLLNRFISMSKDKTCVIISHRVGICKRADRIVVMHKGKIAEIGTHEELMEHHSKYYELWEAQAQWYQ